jgi:hypothetical protein
MLSDAGAKRLLEYLLNEVAVDWEFISRPIRTTALRDQQLQALGAQEEWLFHVLVEGELPGDLNGDGTAAVATVFSDFERMAKLRGERRVSPERLGRFLKKFGVGKTRKRIHGELTYVYEFPPLSEARRNFARQLASEPEWGDANEWVKSLPTFGVAA